jgi:hypothetical protein
MAANNELERMLKEVVVAKFKVLPPQINYCLSECGVEEGHTQAYACLPFVEDSVPPPPTSSLHGETSSVWHILVCALHCSRSVTRINSRLQGSKERVS